MARAAAFKGYDDRIYVCVNIKSKEMIWVMLSPQERVYGRTPKVGSPCLQRRHPFARDASFSQGEKEPG
jgi:hypothetical protein